MVRPPLPSVPTGLNANVQAVTIVGPVNALAPARDCTKPGAFSVRAIAPPIVPEKLAGLAGTRVSATGAAFHNRTAASTQPGCRKRYNR